MKHLIFLFLFLPLFIAGFAQSSSRRKGTSRVQPPPVAVVSSPVDLSAYEKHVWVGADNDSLPYRLLLPKDFDPARKYPLILFLHGAGERGNDNEAQLVHGGKLFLQPDVRENYEAIVVFPQCKSSSFWSNVEFKMNETTKKRDFNFLKEGAVTPPMARVMELLDHLKKQFNIKPDQRYVMGLSMGGMGTFEIVRRKPAYFAAAVPICGGANPETAGQIKQTAFWIFHGAKDDVVPPELSKNMVMALQKYYSAAEVQFTIYPEANHNSWDPAFAEPELLKWLFSQRLTL